LELKINEEFKNLIPPPTEEERAELEKSILMFGCRDKIITWNDIIIDGHNRYEICTRNGVKFEILKMDYDFENEEEVKQWIIKNQFARRNISSYQRSVLALQLKESIAKKAKENQSLAGGDKKSEEVKSLSQKSAEVITKQESSTESINFDSNKDELEPYESTSNTLEKIVKPIDTREEVAKIAGVSHDTIRKVETIEKEAPEVIKTAAKENDISINKAYNFTKEVKDLDEKEKESKAAELLNQQYDAKAKEIDKQKKIADKIADVIFGILTTTIDEERIEYYLEYSPQESLEKHISRCDEAIKKLQQVKNIFENMRKIKVVK
jgi:transcriptional regulator with XRE-family HTH domain